jgi:hypothetical protein
VSLYQVAAVAVVMLTAALVFCARIAASRQRRVDELEKSLESAREELRRLGEYQNKKEEAQQNADAKKETLHTGNVAADFDSSIDVLHGASKNRSY